MTHQAENDEILEEFISDGFTGATREIYTVTKQQLREQLTAIQIKLQKKGVIIPKKGN
jgi:hypothetical protein